MCNRAALLCCALLLGSVAVVPARADLINVALGGVATQSTTPYAGQPFPGLASNAIDGNTDGGWSNGSVTHTDYGFSWWQVDLGIEYLISEIDIWNRTDYAPGRLSDFQVFVLDGSLAVAWTQGYTGPITPPSYASYMLSITLPEGILGRYVEISFPTHQDYLSLAEVQVWSEQESGVPEPATWVLTMFALSALVWRARSR